MTGRDLIIYILQNNLEDKPVFENGKILGFLTVSEAAVKFNVGTAVIKLWYKLGILSGFKIGEEIYIPVNETIDVEKMREYSTCKKTIV